MYSGPAAKVPRSGTPRKASTYHSRPSKPVSYSTTKQGSSGQGSQGSSGQGRVLVNPKKFNPAEKARLAEELREKKYRDKMCNMCSEVNLPIYHHHFSSTDIRRMSNSEGNKSYCEDRKSDGKDVKFSRISEEGKFSGAKLLSRILRIRTKAPH